MRVFSLGYCGTGSSAVVHLIKEYENCQNDYDKDFEHVLFYAPHGLFDLEDSLLGNNAIFRSDAAIKDFYYAMKRLNDNDFVWFGGYKKRFGNKFMKIVHDFIDSLVEYSCQGGWSNDYQYVRKKVSLRTKIKYFIKKYFLMKKVKYPISQTLDCFGDDGVINYCFATPNEFYEKAKKFVDSYFSLLGYTGDKLIVIDQIIQPQQLKRFMNYAYPDDKFIVVKRDPRDVYLYSKYIWPQKFNGSFFPSSPIDFSSFYIRFLSTEKKCEDSRVLRLYFEDLVYKYEDTIALIEDFVGKDKLGNHTFKKKFFLPNQSIKNTQLFSIDKEWKDEIKPIEQFMQNELYSFPFVSKTSLGEISDPTPNTFKEKQ